MNKQTREVLFVDWLTLHQGIVIKVARSFTTEPADTDDLVQEILLRVWASVDRYRAEAKVSTWIYRIALNRALTWERDGQKRRTEQPLIGAIHELPGQERADDSERLGHLYEQIRKLGEIDRSLVLLSLDGMTYTEMSEITGISESNVGARLSRARTRLFAFIQEDRT